MVRAARYDVRLILTDLVASTADGRGDDSLRVDAVLLHSLGPGTATVTRIHRAGGSLVVRVAALPVALSGNHPIERVRLRITPLDCGLAAGWTPSAQPFTVTWRDEDGRVRTDPGGDHDASMSLALVRWVDRACGDPGEDEQS